MTEKRFTYDSKTVSILKDGDFWLDGQVDTACNHSEICNELNKLIDENEQLKQSYTKLEHRHSLLHDECLDAECDRDSYCKDVLSLEEENEQLKIIRSDLASELDIVQNELNIAIDKGFAPSQPYINYMASKKTEYDKFWENKVKTHNNRLKGVRE